MSKSLVPKLKKIRLLALDVDGVMTDCRTFMGEHFEWRRQFSIRDGYGIKRLIDAGYEIAVITGTVARDIQERVKQLRIKYFYEGFLEKLPAFEKLQQESGFKAEQIAYMGDDLFDIPVLDGAGFSATVSDAMGDVFKHSDYKAKRPAGNGAVREVCDLILQHGALAQKGGRKK